MVWTRDIFRVNYALDGKVQAKDAQGFEKFLRLRTGAAPGVALLLLIAPG
jgi:hypothetical protein